MAKREMTLVYYHVPEDKDDPDSPNVFGVNQSRNSLRVSHIREQFPLKGTYIFRFKVSYENVLAWLDISDSDAKLPSFRDKIVVKATRVSWEQQPILAFVKTNSVPVSSNGSSQAKYSPQIPKAQIDFFLPHEKKENPPQAFNLLDSPPKPTNLLDNVTNKEQKSDDSWLL